MSSRPGVPTHVGAVADASRLRPYAPYRFSANRDLFAFVAELASEGIVDLLLNGAKTRREHAGHSTGDVGASFIERIGTKAIRVFKASDTGAMVAECMARDPLALKPPVLYNIHKPTALRRT